MKFVDLNKPFLTLLASAPNSGKTHMIKYMIKEMVLSRAVDYVYVFCGSGTDEYQFIPAGFATSQYSDSKLKRIMRNARDNGGNGAIVLDDMLGSQINLNSKLITHLMTTYRHYGLRVIIATQYVNKIPAVVRESSKYALIWRQRTVRALEAVRDSYLGQTRNAREAEQYLKSRLQGKYDVLAINTQTGKERVIAAPANVNIQIRNFGGN